MLFRHVGGQLNQRLFCGSQEFVSPYQILILKFLGLFSISYVRMRTTSAQTTQAVNQKNIRHLQSALLYANYHLCKRPVFL